jgi:hypothetical protein
MQAEVRTKMTASRLSAVAGTCPDCCGDVALSRRGGQLLLSCQHCGLIIDRV